MKKILSIAAAISLAMIPGAAFAVDAGDQLALNAVLENKSNVPIVVIGFCRIGARHIDGLECDGSGRRAPGPKGG